MVALATHSFQADADGVMGPGSTAGILILLGLGLAGLGNGVGGRSFKEHLSTVATWPWE